jgi:putative PEP-CTERM system TPR-repeat lipoprotein
MNPIKPAGQILLLLLMSLPAYALDREGAAASYYDDAMNRYQKHDDSGAIIQLKNALQQAPKMLPALLLLGQAQLRKGDAAGAERVFADAEKLGIDRSQIATEYAQALYQQGKLKTLLDKFTPEGLPDGVRLDILLLRAQAQLDLGQRDLALTSVQQAAKVPDGEARALALQAKILLVDGRLPEAKSVAQRAVQLAPRDADAWTMQASVAHASGDLNKALQGYSRALELRPAQLEARLARVGLLFDLKRDAQALPDLDYLHTHFAADPRGNYLRALYFSRKGDEATARTALAEVTRVLALTSPDYLTQHDQLRLVGGLASFALGQNEQAKRWLTGYLAGHPNEAGARKVLGAIYLGERRYDDAIDMLEAARKVAGDDVRLLAMLGSAYMAQGKNAKAADYLEQAAKLQDSPEIQTGLGLSLLGAGREDSGFAALLRAYQADPVKSQAGATLALVYIRRGEPKQAAALLQDMLKRTPGNLALRNLLGGALRAAGDRAGARAAYVAVINADPTMIAAHLNLAQLDLVEGKVDAARRRYLGIIKVVPRQVPAMLALALVEERSGHVDQAIRWLDKANSLTGRDLRPMLALTELYLRQGNAQKALDSAKDAQAVAPEAVDVQLTLARAQIAVGHMAAARVTLGRVSRQAAFAPVLMTRVAGLQWQAGDSAAATYSLGKALSSDANYLPALTLLTRIELQNGKLAEAEQRVNALRAQQPENVEVQLLLGDVRLAQKRYDDAIQAYRAAFARAPNEDALARLYRALMAAGKPGEAIPLLAAWSKTHPADRQAYHALGEAFMAMSDWPRARATYAELVRTQPNDAKANNNLALVLIQLRDPTALQYAQRARDLAPTMPQTNDTLGWLLVQQGQTEKGIRYLLEASLRAPNDPEIRQHLMVARAKAS